MMDFRGKVIVVTGGASGIGQATAGEFGQLHGAVAVVDADAKAGSETVDGLRRKGGIAEYFRADISVRSEVEQVIPVIVAKLGGIDVLINNAGIQRYGT